ncbi:hypothetical protein BDV95DRAFT_173628 [Massariosphaeria phaeospora]|uniref:ATP-grasp domain-containing protein n=1 Tax=Massariosphaeria phaeospora TaxID=100035 RepID=A0A7C8M548_9PLEO|nr:hypothetical protein BDV95DRAFT_173628 [Massariosphaeria phaeospora]
MVVKKGQQIVLAFDGLRDKGYLEISPISSDATQRSTTFWSLDVVLQSRVSPATDDGSDNIHTVSLPRTDSPVTTFLASTLKSLGDDAASDSVSLRFLFPKESGYVARSDFLEHRLEGSQYVSKAVSFLSPLQKVVAVERPSNTSTFGEVLLDAFGVLIISATPDSQDLDHDLLNRLSFPWLLASPLASRRLAWIQGREDIDSIGRALKGAAALGISLVVFDEPGHWLQPSDSPWSYLREAFVELDITPDDRLANRVADAVRAYLDKIDGVVTISDIRLPEIARACRMLGLPTESAEAYDIARDKGKTRMLEVVGKGESCVLSDASELDHYLERTQPLQFPLIVKPVIGWCSDCVSKVQTVEELAVAVRKASDRHADSARRSTAVVIEPYINGPEVDANLALLDGEVVFCDISDDFPSPADDNGAGFKANFQETQNVMPSGLPQFELDAIKAQMRDSILRQGFRSGVFHCEARVRNSSVKYTTGNGITDLAPKENIENLGTPQVYLHEINARPPGYLESVAVLLTYGVDYYAIRMLLALGPTEKQRIHALSHPFLQGPQYNLSVMIVQQTCAGIMKTADAGKEFLDKYPDIRNNVVDYYTRMKGGDVLEGPDADALWWIAYFSVFSRESRRELLERVEFIQRNFEYELEA